MLFFRFSQGWSKGGLHAVDAAKDDKDSKDAVDDLVEDWILEIVVVCGDAGAEEGEKDAQADLSSLRLAIGKRGIRHEASRVDHVELVHQLPGILQRGVEHETTESNQEVANIGHLKDCIMAMFSATFDTFVGKIEEHEIREGVDDLGRVVCGIIVLLTSVHLAPDSNVLFLVPLHTIPRYW